MEATRTLPPDIQIPCNEPGPCWANAETGDPPGQSASRRKLTRAPESLLCWTACAASPSARGTAWAATRVGGNHALEAGSWCSRAVDAQPGRFAPSICRSTPGPRPHGQDDVSPPLAVFSGGWTLEAAE